MGDGFKNATTFYDYVWSYGHAYILRTRHTYHSLRSHADVVYVMR